jgi:hypothetical protein
MDSYKWQWNIGMHFTMKFSCILLSIHISVTIQRNVHFHVELDSLSGVQLAYKHACNALSIKGDFDTILHGITHSLSHHSIVANEPVMLLFNKDSDAISPIM